MDNGISYASSSRGKKKGLNQRKKTILYLLIISLVLLFIAIGGFCLKDAAMVTDFSRKNLMPSQGHPFGTDWMGRDMLMRTIKGLSLSIIVGMVAASVSALIGMVLGATAALCGRKIDAVISWGIDLLLGIPHLVLLILISFALGKGLTGVIVGIALTHWTSMARIIRGEILQLKERPYVKIAEKLGQSRFRIAIKHMVPHILPQFLVGLILLFPHAILHEASITFLGFGLSPDQPAIGIILSESMRYLTTGLWWLALFPGLALVGIVVLFDLAGGSLRKLLDPYRVHD